MYVLVTVISFFLAVSSILAFPEKDVPNVDPEYLDMLLQTNQYELFSKLMKIDDVDLVRPSDDARSTHPMFNKGLAFGDILIPKEHREEARQGIRFEVWGGSKWQNGYVPYAIASSYNQDQRNIILNAINRWNQQVQCLKLYPRSNEDDYVMFFDGNGCYSYFGRRGGQQAISLQSTGLGCLYQGTVLHEIDHAIGMAHEQNRDDRDDYVNILWDNIPESWKSQYQKVNTQDWNRIGSYDYYSIMHYRLEAPENNKQAIEITRQGVDANRVGRGQDFTPTDLEKIRFQYC